MIKVYYAKINSQWNEVLMKEKIAPLPVKMQQQAMSYRHWQDSQLSIAGRLLLQKLLQEFELNKVLDINNLLYNEFGKPYFNHAFNFNISHTDGIVVCAASTTCKTGIDIEKIKPIAIDELSDYFTSDEIEAINNSTDKYAAFYETWTKKEAFIKNIGTGLQSELSGINTLTDAIIFEDNNYYFTKVPIEEGYVCFSCSTEKQAGTTVAEVII